MADAADIEDVLAANTSFYDAFERRSLESMAQVWEHSERVVCTHPGWPILRGWPIVEESWRRIFDGPGRNQFIVTNDVAVVVEGIALPLVHAAWITAVVFTVLNAALLTVRIRVEDAALATLPDVESTHV